MCAKSLPPPSQAVVVRDPLCSADGSPAVRDSPCSTDSADTEGSPINGMPVLEVWHAASVIMIKRSLSPGFAGIKNALFEYDNTMMMFEDAKKAVQGMAKELKEL